MSHASRGPSQILIEACEVSRTYQMGRREHALFFAQNCYLSIFQEGILSGLTIVPPPRRKLILRQAQITRATFPENLLRTIQQTI